MHPSHDDTAPLGSEAPARRRSRYAVGGMFVLAIATVLYIASDLFIPIAVALLLNILLSPVVRALNALRIPTPAAAALLMTTLVGVSAVGLGVLAEPAEQWLSSAPKSIRDIKQEAFSARGSLANIQELAAEVEELTTPDVPADAQSVIVQGPGILESLLGGLPSLATFAGIVVFLTYFLLASGDTLLRRMTTCGRTWSERRRVVTIARQVQSELSRYLATVTIINTGLGLCVAIMMHFLDVPNPLLWGVMVALFNFAPYVGAMASAVVLTLVAVTSFESVTQAMTVPLSFAALTILEGQIVTPAILGRRMSLSPVFVFLAVVFWGWLWGVAGALMAVPIVTSLKVLCDHIPSLEHVANFVRNDDSNVTTRAARTTGTVAGKTYQG